MHTHTTKNDLYAELICLGRKKEYAVIPEFRVQVPPLTLDGPMRTKNIDLVWAKRLKEGPQTGPWQFHWELIATFEIEACDVKREFDRHIRDLPKILNRDENVSIHHFIVLYTNAFDRNWNADRPILDEIRKRRELAAGSGVSVLDGRNLLSLDAIF
jgi:hypothetical protein